MSSQRPLTGSCYCGRNQYIIRIPQDATDALRVYFDNSHTHRRAQATPLSAWLRIPLTWYQSTTESYLPDEAHSAIRRSYTSPREQNTKRCFCGFCGTPLSYWSESPPSEAQYISLTLGSLSGNDLRDLEDLGLLPSEVLADAENDKEKIETAVSGTRDAMVDDSEGLPWFETLVEGSKLGNMRRSWGSRQSGNGRFKIEWEIMEWTDDNENTLPAKRKIGEVVEDEAMEEDH